MTRTYTLKKRAEQQAETRLRIVEAAVELHGSVGPARTSLSMVAERAGVQRNTLYAHFPEEWDLLLACSGLAMERDPPPDAEAWRGTGGPAARLRAGLTAVYGWYGRSPQLLGCVLRDAQHHEPTRKISELRFGPSVMAWRAILGEGLTGVQLALLHLALDFHAWRALAEAGLDTAQAAETMVRAIEGAGR